MDEEIGGATCRPKQQGAARVSQSKIAKPVGILQLKILAFNEELFLKGHPRKSKKKTHFSDTLWTTTV